ncbi:FtsQ-type POTRA domain-containing protein [Alphaproteobacteria bacterium]|nr:FtsQ-type POTRA domain-containing protein [Alphaproteobacteria bacterium]
MRRLMPRFGKSTGGKSTGGKSTEASSAQNSGKVTLVNGVNVAKAAKPSETGVTIQRRLSRVKLVIWSIIGVTMVTMGAYAAMDRDQLGDRIVTFTGTAGLNLQKIKVEGRAHTPHELLLEVSALKRGQPIYSIDLRTLHERLSAIGWIEDVTVERRMPSTIRIILQERVPVALLQTPSGHELIDQSGAVITGASPEDFSHLTVVSGDGAAPRAGAIIDLLRTEPELFSNVWAISLQSGRRWDVHLRNGIDIRLPELDPSTAWSRLAIMDHSKQITRRDLAVIDLRVPEQLIVEPNIPVRGKGSKT